MYLQVPFFSRPKRTACTSNAAAQKAGRLITASLQKQMLYTSNFMQVKSSIEHGLRELLQEREVDRERELGPRILGQAARFLPAFDLLQGFGSRQ